MPFTKERDHQIQKITDFIPRVYQHIHRVVNDNDLLIIDPTHPNIVKWLPLQKDTVLEVESHTNDGLLTPSPEINSPQYMQLIM